MKTEFNIFNGDSLEVLKSLATSSVDSLVTDPPAGIGFLKNDWDSNKGGRDKWIQWMEQIMKEVLRVLKPGAHGFVWAIPRTSHWTAMALENSGFIVKDVVTHIFASGFPKSLAVDGLIQSSKRLDMSSVYTVTSWIRNRKNQLGLTNKEIDKHTGVTGCTTHWTATHGSKNAQIPPKKRWLKIIELLGIPPSHISKIVHDYHNQKYTEPDKAIVEESKKWQGWGTSLKPASEHWILVQKPLSEISIASNVIKLRTGALNIDDSRIKSTDLIRKTKNPDLSKSPFFGSFTNDKNRVTEYVPNERGRFPANLMLTSSKNQAHSMSAYLNHSAGKDISKFFKSFNLEKPFIYCPKPTRKEKGEFNTHPTVKPIALMKYLIILITPPQGIVIDPFMGSGTTGVSALLEGFKFLGIEKSKDYFEISKKRLNGVVKKETSASASQVTNTGLGPERKVVYG